MDVLVFRFTLKITRLRITISMIGNTIHNTIVLVLMPTVSGVDDVVEPSVDVDVDVFVVCGELVPCVVVGGVVVVVDVVPGTFVVVVVVVDVIVAGVVVVTLTVVADVVPGRGGCVDEISVVVIFIVVAAVVLTVVASVLFCRR